MLLLAQITTEQLTFAGVSAVGLYILKSLADLWAQISETKDRKIMREQLTQQTEVLRNIHSEQVDIRKLNEDARSNLNVAMDRQVTTDDLKHVCKFKGGC